MQKGFNEWLVMCAAISLLSCCVHGESHYQAGQNNGNLLIDNACSGEFNGQSQVCNCASFFRDNTELYLMTIDGDRTCQQANYRGQYEAWFTYWNYCTFGDWVQLNIVSTDEEREVHRKGSWCSSQYNFEDNRQNVGYEMDMGVLAGLTYDDEVNQHLLNDVLPPDIEDPVDNNRNQQSCVSDTVPESKDWIKEGFTTPVRYQKSCGSCWAFAVTSALESAILIGGGKKLDISQQYLLDCDGNNGGCNGGWPPNAQKHFITNGYFVLENDYPYRAESDGVCRLGPKDSVVRDYAVEEIHSITTVDGLKCIVGTQQPVMAYVDATEWNTYSSGIFDGNCSRNINHAVFLVGYGNENGTDYWLIQNSWGESFGDKGTIKVRIDEDGIHGGNCGQQRYGLHYPSVGGTNSEDWPFSRCANGVARDEKGQCKCGDGRLTTDGYCEPEPTPCPEGEKLDPRGGCYCIDGYQRIDGICQKVEEGQLDEIRNMVHELTISQDNANEEIINKNNELLDMMIAQNDRMNNLSFNVVKSSPSSEIDRGEEKW